MRGCMDEESIAELLKSVQGFPDLVTWQIVSMSEEDEELKKGMAKLAESDLFSPEILSTAAHSNRSFVSLDLPDATVTPWVIPESPSPSNVLKDGPWRNLRPRTTPVTVSLKTRRFQRKKNILLNRVTLERFVQHVSNLSTLLLICVFKCIL